MEFFFPSDVFTFEQPHSRPSSLHTGCSIDASIYRPSFIDVIRQQEAAQARAQAIQHARAIRRAQEERQVLAYVEHIYHIQKQQELLRQRQAERQRQLQLQRERERERQQQQQRLRRQLYAEYQRQKALEIQQEQQRRRINAVRDAEKQSRQFFLSLNDLIFGFEPQDDISQQPVASPSKSATSSSSSAAVTKNGCQTEIRTEPMPQSADDVKGKDKAQQVEIETDDESIQANLVPLIRLAESIFGTIVEASNEVGAEDMAKSSQSRNEFDDPNEVGPIPSTSNEPQEKQTNTSEGNVADDLVSTPSSPHEEQHGHNSRKTDSIPIPVDQNSYKATVSGQRKTEPTSTSHSSHNYIIRPSSPTPSVESSGSTSSRQSRTPKQAHVNDVDENGEEILPRDDVNGDEEYVHID